MEAPLVSDVPRVAIQLTRGFLFASINVELQEEGWRRFQQDLLERLHSSAVSGAVLDLSGVEILDSRDFEAIRRVTAMATLMGARTVLSGLRPGVVSSLIEMDVDLDGLEATATPDDAFELLTPATPTAPPAENETDANGDQDPDSE
jgi:rsbT antagonist protein RsbS